MINSDDLTEIDLANTPCPLHNPDGSPVIFTNVRKIYIPKSFQIHQYNNLDNLMFPNLESIQIDPENTSLKSIGPLLIAHDMLRFVFSAGKYKTITLPECIQSIGYQAFKHTFCANIICKAQAIDLHPSAFEDSFWDQTSDALIINTPKDSTLCQISLCDKTTLTIPDNVTRIDETAFNNKYFVSTKKNMVRFLIQNEIPANTLYITDIHKLISPLPLSMMISGASKYLNPISHYIIKNAPYLDLSLLNSPVLQYIEIQDLDGASPYKTKDGILFSKDMTSLLKYPCGNMHKNYQVPEGVEYVLDMSNTHVKKIAFPKSLKSLKQATFSGSKITELTVHLNTATGLFDILPTVPKKLYVIQPDGSINDYQFENSNITLKSQLAIIWDQHQFDQDHIDFAIFSGTTNRAKKRTIALQNIARNNALPGYLTYLKRSAFAYGRELMDQRNEDLIINFLKDESVYLTENALKSLLTLSQNLQLATVTAYLMNYLHERGATNSSLKL